MDETARIVVGVDGSEGSLRALAVARHEAVLCGGSVEVVMAWDHLNQPGPPGEGHFDPHFTAAQADTFLDEMLAATPGDDGVTITGRAVLDHPASALLDAGEDAALLVVGARGHGGFLGLRLGSVSQKVLHHAPCPVLVCRDTTDASATADGGPVVAGVDGSEPSRLAVRWAAEEAVRRQVRLIAVHGWGVPSSATGPMADPTAFNLSEAFAQAAHGLVESEVDRVRDQVPGLDVEARADDSGASGALMSAAVGASLAVVGTRGQGGFAGLLVGSVSQQLAHHAPCPVVVVPAAD